MAQAGVYAPGPVIDVDVVVRVNGVVREHVSMDWAGDTTGGLPEQVVSAGTGMKSRTGSILWAQQTVQAEPPHPLRQANGWPPREGDTVEIDATVDTGQGPYQFRRFTGRLGRTTGSLTDGTLTSEITDLLGDRLRALTRIDPLGPESSRGYTRSSWVAYRAIEAAGLGTLPSPDDPSVVLHIGGQGGWVAAVGTTLSSGLGYGDGDIEVASDPAGSPDPRPRTGGVALIMARGSQFYDSSVRVTFTTGATFTLAMTIASKTLTLSSSAQGTLWTGAWVGAGVHPVLAFVVSSGECRAWTGTAWVTIAATTPPTTTRVSEVRGAGRVASIQARYHDWQADAFSAVYDIPAYPAALRRSALETVRIPATRGVENVTARSVVDAWSEATLSSVWMDEHGRVRMVARDVLATTAPSRTLQVSERVLAGSWSVGDDSVRSRVTLRGQAAAVEAWPNDRTTLYQESTARSVEAPATIERFIEVPSEEEWGPADLTPSRFGIDPMLGNLPGRGTWDGGVSSLSDSNEDPETWLSFNGITLDTTIERLGQRTLKVTETISGIPSGRTVYLKTPLVGTMIHPTYRGQALPVIRGAWKSVWTDYAVESGTRGPSWAPALELDAGWWLTPTDAQRVVDALATEVTSPMPTMSGVTVLWDPRRQIGDVETWVATGSDGVESWRVNVLVTGYSESWDGKVPSQQVDVRVISWTDPTDGKTYGDLAAAYGNYVSMTGRTYQQVYDALPST